MATTQSYWSNCPPSSVAPNAGCYLYTGSNHHTAVPNGDYALYGTDLYLTVSGGAGLITAITGCPLPKGAQWLIKSDGGGVAQYTYIDIYGATQIASTSNTGDGDPICTQCGTTVTRIGLHTRPPVADGSCAGGACP